MRKQIFVTRESVCMADDCFAPNLKSADEACTFIMKAISAAVTMIQLPARSHSRFRPIHVEANCGPSRDESLILDFPFLLAGKTIQFRGRAEGFAGFIAHRAGPGLARAALRCKSKDRSTDPRPETFRTRGLLE